MFSGTVGKVEKLFATISKKQQNKSANCDSNSNYQCSNWHNAVVGNKLIVVASPGT